MKNFILLFIAFIALGLNSLQARQITSTQTGGFTTSSTWVSSVTPAAGDTITISSGHTVTVSSNLSYSGSKMFVKVYGTLKFSGGGSKLRMPTGSAVQVFTNGQIITTGSGGGNSQVISAGSSTLWTKADGDVTFPVYFDANNPLPVTLVYFKAEQKSKSVILTWMTSVEINNDRFEIERSIDGKNWNTIGTISGNGNSNQNIEYSFEDNYEVNGFVYYRLKQYDYNSAMTVSSHAVVGNTENTQVQITGLNTVFNDQISFFQNNASQITVSLYSLDGKEMINNNQVSMNQGGTVINGLSNLPMGIYILNINIDGKTTNHKVLKSSF